MHAAHVVLYLRPRCIAVTSATWQHFDSPLSRSVTRVSLASSNGNATTLSVPSPPQLPAGYLWLPKPRAARLTQQPSPINIASGKKDADAPVAAQCHSSPGGSGIGASGHPARSSRTDSEGARLPRDPLGHGRGPRSALPGSLRTWRESWSAGENTAHTPPSLRGRGPPGSPSNCAGCDV
jgi:hypothetical protein